MLHQTQGLDHRWLQPEPEQLEDWAGSFEFYQVPRIMEVFARHTGLELVDLGGALALVTRRPGFGTLRIFLGGPEAAKSSEAWREPLVDADFGYLQIRTIQPIPEHEAFRTSANDNRAMVVDLAVGLDGLLQSYEKRCRTAVRSGIRRGVEVRVAETEADFQTFQEIVLNASNGGKLFHVPPMALLRDLVGCGHGVLQLAIAGGRIVSGAFFVLSRSMVGLVAGSDREFADLKPNNVLHFESMRWAIENGFRYYDLGDQSLTANPNLALFKRGFRPKLAPAMQYVVPGKAWKRWLLDLRGRLRWNGS